MSPLRDNRSKLLAIAAVLAIVVIVVIVMSPAKNRNLGALAAVAKLSGGGAGVSEIAYTVSGNGIPAISGTARITGADGTPISVKDLPADTDYEIELSAASPDGKTKCNRRTPFDVTVGQTTSLTVVVLCRDMTRIAQFVLGRKAAAPTLAAVAPPPSIEVTPECTACEQAGIKSGECEPDSGCDGLEGNDKTLCVNLVNCMRATNCWIKDPLDCLCGTARDEACITNAANGDCRAEMQAATKTNDPVQNGTLFYESSVPAGRANRLISCDKERCRSHCSVQ